MVLNDDWLNLTPEEALEPELPILDPHHHLWERPGNRYLLDDLVQDTADHAVRQTVFIECSSMYRPSGPTALMPVGETEFVQGVAAKSANGGYGDTVAAAGIVGTADLSLGDDVSAVLEAQIVASPQRFRGIRHRAAWPERTPMPGQPASAEHLLLDSSFRAGFNRLRHYALSFEAWVLHTHLDDVADLARAFPDTSIILNHLGGPIVTDETRDEVFDSWRPKIAAIAESPNVVMKLGGIQMVVNGFGWDQRERPPSSDELVETNRPWYEYAIEQFGPDRCMFESNFPVDRLSCSYTVLWNQFKKLSQGFSDDERIAMFHDTAARIYRLPLASDTSS
jgi:predicted TIM-barrel fold metal-dependent hydrolase